MELIELMHPNKMKQLFLIYIFFVCLKSNAQDTLYLEVHGLGHEKYVLKEDGTYVYSTFLCGSSSVSFGTFKKTIYGYNFRYDSSKCPNPSIFEINSGSNHNSLTINFYDMLDSTAQPCFAPLNIGGKKYFCDSNLIKIPKDSLHSNVLTIGQNSNRLVFKFDTTATELNVYLPSPVFGYKCGDNGIRKLKKTKKGYLHKFIVYDEIEEKPWKRGTKRIVRHYYQLK